MADHASIAPSSAAVWGAPDGCTGSVAMQLCYPPSGDTPEAEEGRLSHGLAEEMIRKPSLLQTEIAGVDAEIVQGARMYAEHVHSILGPGPEYPGRVSVEKHLEAPNRVHPKNFGTVDSYLWSHLTLELTVWDYKYGYGIVEAFENWQLINYVACIFDQFGLGPGLLPHVSVTMFVVQPRAPHVDGPIRQWKLQGDAFTPYFENLAEKAAEALSDQAITRSGSHCRYCSARFNCPTAIDAAMKFYELATTPTPLFLSDEALSLQLSIAHRASKQIEYIITGLEEELTAKLRQGARVPGHRLERRQGNRCWTEDNETVIEMGALCGVDLLKKSLLTPAQAEKAGLPREIIDGITNRPYRGLGLVEDNGAFARRIFSR